MIDIVAPVGRPAVPRTFHQLGILVLDGSGSMTETAAGNSTKAKEVSAAVHELFNRLNASRVKQNFSFSCIKFDDTATVSLQPTPFDFNTLANEDYDPTSGKGGGTQIFLALEKAKQVAESFLQNAPKDGVKHSVLILLMSDGMCFDPQRTISTANQIKSNQGIEIACAFFGAIGESASAEKQTLKDVSSDPAKYFTTVYDGEALRAFFERSISQSSGIKVG